MKYYGFNMLYMFSKGYEDSSTLVDERELEFIAKHGFNYIRIPMDYRFWTKDYNYLEPDEKVFELIDGYYETCKKHGLHICLNLHRAPGYCINGNNLEKHNLWKDEEARLAFIFIWEKLAKRYKGISAKEMSFDLLNEPPSEGEYGFTRDIHQKIMRPTIAAIKTIDPDRPIVLDGIGGGHEAIPEMADAGVIHSGRGYTPFQISHNQAGWCDDMEWIEPVYPGISDDGLHWDRDAIIEFYKPWREVEKTGVEVYIGEFGCYNKTPNDIAIRWFSDLLSVFKEFNWGYALWNFKGAFGIVEHGRPGTKYQEIDGFKVDSELLNLLKENMR
ncbi:MAG: cellulase family glycosylhydrolase [Oscillospiraceae bacterium]|jgi:aryl-phospho-beta-D-glucosidase BglC (GH1 family)|nr:cellulase family glycosylhydrolase [Oscillospiraceae bacterium]